MMDTHEMIIEGASGSTATQQVLIVSATSKRRILSMARDGYWNVDGLLIVVKSRLEGKLLVEAGFNCYV